MTTAFLDDSTTSFGGTSMHSTFATHATSTTSRSTTMLRSSTTNVTNAIGPDESDDESDFPWLIIGAVIAAAMLLGGSSLLLRNLYQRRIAGHAKELTNVVPDAPIFAEAAAPSELSAK